MRKFKSISAFGLILAIITTLANPAAAWCNRKQQPGVSGPTDLVLPEVPPSPKPFSFESPDPRRLIAPVEVKFDPSAPTTYLIAIGNNLSPQQAIDVQTAVLGLLTRALCHPQDRIEVFSSDLRRIATFSNHPRVLDCAETWGKFRLQHNAAAIGQFNRWAAELKSASKDGSAALDLPHLTHHLAQEFHEHSEGNRVLIFMGSAIELSPEIPYLKTSYPTIGTLRAELSPLSTRGLGDNLGNISSHFIYLNAFKRETHRRGIQNFLAAYFLSQGSCLLTFSADTDLASRVRMPGLPPLSAYVDDINPGFVSVESAELFGTGSGSDLPSQLDRGSFMVGLKWDQPAVDLDLHVSVRGKTGELSFRSPQTSFGSFGKEPGNGWEVARLNAEFQPQDLVITVNFYSGVAPAGGVKAELRVAYAGTLFTKSVSFSGQGNSGKSGSPEHWRQVDAGAMVTFQK
jgi:hypothetical protein